VKVSTNTTGQAHFYNTSIKNITCKSNQHVSVNYILQNIFLIDPNQL